jgi:CheY-like chemotaxis protein
LVVDDNVDSADTMVALLRMDGHKAEAVFDGESALRRAREMSPEVILLDIGLPGMDGLQVARELRTRGTAMQTVLVALTGYGQPEDRTRSLAAGCDYHLVKPIEPEALKTLLEGLEETRNAKLS